MKARQFMGDGKPLTMNDVDEPEPGPGWVVARVLGTALCHTDVAFVDGGIPSSFMRNVSMTARQELAGVIHAVGDGVTGFSVGDRVGVRPSADGAGRAYHGGFAGLIAASAHHVVKAQLAFPSVTWPSAVTPG